jgi:uncharacterized small protein (DUF1192 family)
VVRRRSRPRAAPERFRAPDDNPDFLGSLRIVSIADQDERIRRLEEELAALDAEARPRPRPAAVRR